MVIVSNNWFRFYGEVLDDPKVQMLPPDQFKSWVNLLCLASKYDGVLPEIAAVSFALRIDETGCLTLIERLLNAGLIDKRNGGPNGYHYAPHGWDKRQYKSDTSTDRVKRYRERKKRSDETAPDTETDTELSSEAKASSVKAKAPSKPKFDFSCPDGVDPIHWRDFRIARKRKGAVETETAYSGILKKLAEYSSDEWPPGRLVQRSAEKGWGKIVNPNEQDFRNGTGNRSTNGYSSGSAGQSRTAVAARRSMDSVARFWPDPSDADGRCEGGAGEHRSEAGIGDPQAILRPDDPLPGSLRRIGNG